MLQVRKACTELLESLPNRDLRERAPKNIKTLPTHRQMANRQRSRSSHLKRGYGWDRARIDRTEGTRIWPGHDVLAHNLVKISALAA
jgi:hypothetical protein